MANQVSRRGLLASGGRTAAAVLAGRACGAWLPAALAQNVHGANDRVGLGLIGCGRRGMQLLEHALAIADVVVPVVCDVDQSRSEAAADRIAKAGKPKPVITKEFREVVDHAAVNGVLITTPDHWHMVQLLHACAARKDAYVEAPIAYNISEASAMAFIARKYNRVVQVGQQYRSSPAFHEAVERVQSRRLGRIAQTRTWTFARLEPIARQPDGQAPSGLDYDRWLGPAPLRPYNPARVGEHFAEWWDYSGGRICQWNVHLQDLVHTAMKTNAPKSVVAVGGNIGLQDFRETPDTLEAVFEYEGVYGPFIHVYSLRLSNAQAAWGPPAPPPNSQTDSGRPMHSGMQFHGDQGTLFADWDRIITFDPDGQPVPTRGSPTTRPAARSVPSDRFTQAHLADFVNCLVTRAEPKAPIESGQFALLPCHLANIAYRLGRKVYFDPAGGQCFKDADHKTPDPEADALKLRAYRHPYGPPNV